MQPPLGLTLPCKVLKVYDGDSITVEVRIVANVRLCGDVVKQCWAPELKSTGGLESRDNLLRAALGQTGRLHIPIGEKATNLAALLTMSRVLGDVWIDGQDESLSQMQVRTGHASTKKSGFLGE